MKDFETQYLHVMKKILTKGVPSDNRTGHKTLALFKEDLKVDLKQGFPILTTKKVFFRGVFEEMKLFLSGQTDTKILESKGVNYWKQHTSEEFLNSRGLQCLPEGDMGCGYGHQMRNFGGEHPLIPETKGLKGVDQLQEVLNTLRNDPFSRRINISLWNPQQLQYAALPPCHLYCQLQVNQRTKELNCFFLMRSNDFFLGNPTNMIQYALLVHYLCKMTGFAPGRLEYTGVDVHLYVNQIEGAWTQITRKPSPLPKLVIKKDLKELKDLENMVYGEDIYLENYNPQPAIKVPMIT